MAKTFAIAVAAAIALGSTPALAVDATAAGPIAAADTCIAAVMQRSIDTGRIVADGWSESPIEGVEQMPGGAAGNRLFTRKNAGAVIYVRMLPVEGGIEASCHVIAMRNTADTVIVFTQLFEHLETRPSREGNTFYFATRNPNVIGKLSVDSGKSGQTITMTFIAVTPDIKPQ